MGSRIPFTVAAASVLLAAACAEIPPPAAQSAPVPGAKPAAVSAPSASPEPADPAAFVGRGAREIAELLGEPKLRRRDPPAELWQYRADRCALDLFLYAGRDDVLTVAHAEMRTIPPVGGQTKEAARASSDAPLPGRAREAPFAECLRRIRSGGG
jgi:hypothetical protein